MAKKDFTGALDNVMQNMTQQPTQKKAADDPAAEKPKGKRGRPARKDTDEVQRATFVINSGLLQQLKDITCLETGRQCRKVTLTETLETAIRQYITKYKK